MIQGFGRRGQSIRADIRNIGALRAAADQIEHCIHQAQAVVALTVAIAWSAGQLFRTPFRR
jgi:hypothetical protein